MQEDDPHLSLEESTCCTIKDSIGGVRFFESLPFPKWLPETSAPILKTISLHNIFTKGEEAVVITAFPKAGDYVFPLLV